MPAFSIRILPLLLAAIWAAPAATQPIGLADPTGSTRRATSNDGVTELESVMVYGERDKDEIGRDNVYDKDISNTYTDREYLDRYQGVSVGDVFSGMNGVYNSDNRHGSALFPNLRGLSGNGRIPVTVDGTQQSLDVWMAMRGANNRNYVDPNLFRSIEVEKGPSMTRGIKSGIGGSVNIRTLEADDIIEPGRNWGLEFKASTASNSAKNSYDPFALEGKDYRYIPGAVAESPWGKNNGVSFLKPQMDMRERSDVSRFNGDDRKAFISGAYKHDVFDVMLSYSDARRGNYFAGSKGADKYDEDIGTGTYNPKNTYPNLAKIYAPGYEVPYTHSEAKSVLAKNNWYLPYDQKVSFSYGHNRLGFGEMPAFLSETYNMLVDTDPSMQLARSQFTYPYPSSRINQKTYRFGYEFKPQGSRWIDLEMALWRTANQSTRYQNGDITYEVRDKDDNWDLYTICMYSTNPTYVELCKMLRDFGMFDPDKPPDKQPNIDGKYNIYIGNRTDTRAVRTGLDLSNRLQLSETLAVTIAGDWQYERNRDRIPVETGGVLGMGASHVAFGPASGRREEMGGGLNLEWQVLPRLQFSAGIRYINFWGHDDETDRRRDDRHPLWESGRINTHQKLEYQKLASDEAIALYSASWSGGQAWQDWLAYMAANNVTDSGLAVDSATGARYLKVADLVPLVDGKADRDHNPFYNGQIDAAESMDAQGGTYKKYLIDSNQDANNFAFYKPVDRWQHTERRRGHAWSGQLVASWQLADRARIYGRLSNMARFPSILEFSNRQTLLGEFPYALKPERNQAWEVGATYDLGGVITSVPQADIKLSYYHNTIRNYYDRTENMNVIQFDRKIMTGLELQSRFDTGFIYGNLGGTLRLRQDMCDVNYAVQLDPVLNRIPECMPGGFAGTTSFLSLQPKYSINLDLGVRLFERKLDVGMRMRHHSRASNKKFERLYAQQHGGIFAQTRPYFWRPVTLFDAYAEYRFNRNASARLSVENLTDSYYLDPMAKVPLPGPGRTIRMDLALRY